MLFILGVCLPDVPEISLRYITDGTVYTAIWTNLNRNLDEEGNNILAKTGKYWKTNDEGAAPMLIAAFDPKLDGEWQHFSF